MLAICRQQLDELGLESRCAFHAGYLEPLQPIEPVDAVTSLMINDFFVSIEGGKKGERHPLSSVIENLAFDVNGLIPVIAQDHRSREILMMAWMNREAIDRTLASGDMTYWSRSRSQLWRKGETSGHHQRLISMRFDCDGDTLLCDVEQLGAACHTGRTTCFYLQMDNQSQKVVITDSPPKQDIFSK